MQERPIRVRVRPDVRWLAALIVVPLLVGLLSAFAWRSSVENNLQKRVERQLLANGVSTTEIAVDGRDVKVTVPAGVNTGTARRVVEHVQGVGSAEVHR